MNPARVVQRDTHRNNEAVHRNAHLLRPDPGPDPEARVAAATTAAALAESRARLRELDVLLVRRLAVSEYAEDVPAAV